MNQKTKVEELVSLPYCGSDYQEVFLNEDTVIELIASALLALDVPTIDGINSYIVSQSASNAGFRVAEA